MRQCNQLKNAIEHKLSLGPQAQAQVQELGAKAAGGAAVLAGLLAAGPSLQAALVGAGITGVSAAAGSAAGPFTVHFWAPMSKW